MGRRRKDVWKYTEKLNSPIQGTEADGAKRAMTLIYERRNEAPDVRMILMVHDEMLLEYALDQEERAIAFAQRYCDEGMGAVLHEVDPEVEIEAYLDWGVPPVER